MRRLAIPVLGWVAVLCAPALAQPAARPTDDIRPQPQQPRVQFPGTEWSIAAPPGFALSTSARRTIRRPDGAEIMMFQAPRQALDISSTSAVGTLERKGQPNEAVLESVELATAQSRPAMLIRLRRTRHPSVVHIATVEGTGSNIMAYFSIPNAVVDLDAATIRATLLSLAEQARIQEQRLSDLPFRLRELGGMRLVDTVGDIVILTDGPSDKMDEPTGQPFAVISVFPPNPGERFDAEQALPTLAARLQRGYPGTAVLSTRVEPTPQGPVATIVFERTPTGTKFKFGGTAWMRLTGPQLVFVIAQHPLDRPDMLARIASIRDGVTPR